MSKKILSAGTANVEVAANQTIVADNVLRALSIAGTKISSDKGLQAVTACRNVVGDFFPGNLPAVEAVGVVVTIVTNLVADLLCEIEPAQPISNPEADGRVLAVLEYIKSQVVNGVRAREANKVMAAIRGAGRLN